MNPIEANRVIAKVLAYCPSQSMTELTPDAFAEALDDTRAADAVEAVRRIGRREAEGPLYIEPRHIRAEVRRMRRERLDKHPHIDPPAGLSPSEFIAWQRDVRERIASGETIQPPVIEAREVPDYNAITKDVA